MSITHEIRNKKILKSVGVTGRQKTIAGWHFHSQDWFNMFNEGEWFKAANQSLWALLPGIFGPKHITT